MNEEWGCPQGHRWEQPIGEGKTSTQSKKFTPCPVCGAQGAPLPKLPYEHRVGAASPTSTTGPSDNTLVPRDSSSGSLPNASDATLMPPPSAPVIGHTLVGSSNAGRVSTPVVGQSSTGSG